MGMFGWHDKCVYVCVQCRFTSKYSGSCPMCRASLRAMRDLDTPKKHNKKGWQKIELTIRVADAEPYLDLCRSCMEPYIVRGGRVRHAKLTLSEQRALVRKRLTHHQGEVPQHNKYRIF